MNDKCIWVYIKFYPNREYYLTDCKDENHLMMFMEYPTKETICPNCGKLIEIQEAK